MLITALVLVLVTMLALTSLNHSEQESTGSARTRSASRAIQAADAGIQLGLTRLKQSPPDLDAFEVDLSANTKLESRSRIETAPQDITQVGQGTPEEGYSLNVGSGASSMTRVYLLDVTASSGNSTASLEAKLNRTGADVNGY